MRREHKPVKHRQQNAKSWFQRNEELRLVLLLMVVVVDVVLKVCVCKHRINRFDAVNESKCVCEHKSMWVGVCVFWRVVCVRLRVCECARVCTHAWVHVCVFNVCMCAHIHTNTRREM